jgi:hypothetical protein
MTKIGGRRGSSSVPKVIWTLAELDVQHERVDAGHGYGVTDTPEYLAKKLVCGRANLKADSGRPLHGDCQVQSGRELLRGSARSPRGIARRKHNRGLAR